MMTRSMGPGVAGLEASQRLVSRVSSYIWARGGFSRVKHPLLNVLRPRDEGVSEPFVDLRFQPFVCDNAVLT